jgi:hypothetical protein
LVEEAEAALWKNGRGRKRRRLEDYQVDDETSPQHEWYQQDMPEAYITPSNSRDFLADVNWELQKFNARQLTS